MAAERTSPTMPYTIADLFLQTLADANIDYLFTVLGSDHPSLLEAHLRRQKASQPWPKLLHFQHEFVAISAADGYARITGKPQCVIVHTDVGTLACGQGLHNASSGRAPMLIFAGLAPYTLDGSVVGSRSEGVHWYQDVPGQKAVVEPYVRYSGEVKCAGHVRSMVDRALLMASSGSPGPVYLTAAREVLATPVDGDLLVQRPSIPATVRLGGLPEDSVQTIGDALLAAELPLVCTGYLGRNHKAVTRLVELAYSIRTIGVFDTELREMSFPASHPAWLSRATGGPRAIREADIILVLDADVPWIPAKAAPKPGARIFHIDIDPKKEKMQLFDVPAEAVFHAECAEALKQLVDWVQSRIQSSVAELSEQEKLAMNQKRTRREQVRLATAREQAAARTERAIQALREPHGPISAAHLFATMRRKLPPNTTFVHDAVTNTASLYEQLQLSTPGTSLSKGGSGLGWAGGAAIGVKLALDKYDVSNRPHVQPRQPDSKGTDLVCCVTGDGAFVFENPTATYWAQHRLDTPFLTMVINNGGWKATRSSIEDVHPGGLAAGMSDEELGIDLSSDGPDYCGVAVAASNGTLWAKKVSRTADLEAALTEAAKVVQEEKRGALLDVVVSD